MEILQNSEYLDNPYTDSKGTIIAHSTFDGDGEYHGNDGHTYDVDSGLLGVVPEEMFVGSVCLNGRLVEGKGVATLDCKDGILTITLKMESKEEEKIVIDTHDYREYDEDVYL